MKISYVTTCMNRMNQLLRTLPFNLEEHKDSQEVEFVVVDYGSTVSIATQLKNLQEWGDRGLLRVYRTPSPVVWHNSHAKNLAHKLAAGNIVCNLDVDNFAYRVHTDFVKFTFEHFPRPIMHGHLWSNGCYGRITLYKDDFLFLGGYEEGLTQGWGFEDQDLLNRAQHMGLKMINVPEAFTHTIVHSDDLRGPDVTKERELACKERDKHGHYTANAGRFWGQSIDLERVI